MCDRTIQNKGSILDTNPNTSILSKFHQEKRFSFYQVNSEEQWKVSHTNHWKNHGHRRKTSSYLLYQVK